MKPLILFLFLSIRCFAASAPLPPTTSEVSGDSSNVTTLNYQFPNLPGTHTGTTVSIPTFPLPSPSPSGDYLQANGSAWIATAAAPSNVTSTGSTNYHIEYLYVTTSCTTSPCTITSSSGSWVSSITRVGTGNYVLNFTAGEWTTAPGCVAVSLGVSGTAMVFQSTDYSTSVADMTTVSMADTNFSVICMGI